MPAGQFVGWSSSFIDYDNDGDADIYKVNGALKHLYGQEDQLFENVGEENLLMSQQKAANTSKKRWWEEDHALVIMTMMAILMVYGEPEQSWCISQK